MLPPLFTHKRYLRFVRKQARRHRSLRTDHRHFSVWRKLQRTNLDAAYPCLASLHSPDQGRVARHPTCMFRSWLAMIQCGVASVDVWVPMMHDDPFYAIVSGFDPLDILGVGTFYDFQDRLLKRLRQPRTTQRRPFRRRTQRDKAAHTRIRTTSAPIRASSIAWPTVSWLVRPMRLP